MITNEQLGRGMSYKQYRELLSSLLSKGKTTGHDQGADKIEFAKINIQRMTRLDKTVLLAEPLLRQLAEIKKHYTWLVLTEGWCGDTAQNIPVLHHIEKICPNIRLRLVLRDDNPDIMDQYLTNGGRSIPKLICFENSSLSEMFSWGPRPAPLQQKVLEHIRSGGSAEAKGLLTQQWYNADKNQTLQAELLHLIKTHLH
jgi:hypothetical protein